MSLAYETGSVLIAVIKFPTNRQGDYCSLAVVNPELSRRACTRVGHLCRFVRSR